MKKHALILFFMLGIFIPDINSQNPSSPNNLWEWNSHFQERTENYFDWYYPYCEFLANLNTPEADKQLKYLSRNFWFWSTRLGKGENSQHLGNSYNYQQVLNYYSSGFNCFNNLGNWNLLGPYEGRNGLNNSNPNGFVSKYGKSGCRLYESFRQ